MFLSRDHDVNGSTNKHEHNKSMELNDNLKNQYATNVKYLRALHDTIASIVV